MKNNLANYQKIKQWVLYERPSATFCNGKDNVLNNFCGAEFLAYYYWK